MLAISEKRWVERALDRGEMLPSFQSYPTSGGMSLTRLNIGDPLTRA